jgi:carbamoyl-phosphate synthase large subunit
LTDPVYLIPPAREIGAYLDAVHRLIERESIDLLLPTHPVEVRALSAHRDQFDIPLFLPSHEAIERGQDKYASYQVWARSGVPVPRTDLLRSPADVERLFDEVTLRPVWVRGAGVPGAGIGVASLPCRDRRGAVAWIEYWDGWARMIGSEYLPGDNLTWMGMYHRGMLVASQARQRFEYVIPHVSPSGITGAPAVCRTVCRPDINDIGERAVEAVDVSPNGVYFVDLKGDVDNAPKVTEVNVGRFGTTVHFYTEAGFNFPELYVDLALGQVPAVLPGRDVIEPGITWVRTLDCGPELVRDPSRFDVEMLHRWR